MLHAAMLSDTGDVVFLYYLLFCWKRPYFPPPFCLLFIWALNNRVTKLLSYLSSGSTNFAKHGQNHGTEYFCCCLQRGKSETSKTCPENVGRCKDGVRFVAGAVEETCQG